MDFGGITVDKAAREAEDSTPSKMRRSTVKRHVASTRGISMNPRPGWIVALLLSLSLVASAPAADKAPANGTPDKAVHKNVKADEFEKLSKEPDTVILDVRSAKEYATGHIKDSVLIDFNSKDFVEQLKKLDKSKTYLVHCAVGGRSAKACTKLDGLDFPKVYNLEGGIMAWQRAGKPVEK